MRFTIIDAEQLRWLLRLNDDGTLTWLQPGKYHTDLVGTEAGNAITNRPASHHNGKKYWHVQILCRKIKRSHIVFCLTHGRWPEHQIDHINGNSLDDRPCNLREATPTQNAWNHKRRAKKSPLPMGVRQAVSGRYVARIAVNKKQITIGTFDAPDAASAAYQQARIQHFGEFA